MTPPTRPQPRHMSAFERAAAIERDQQWGDQTPGGEPWSDNRKGVALFMAGYDRRGLLNELGWREPFLDREHLELTVPDPDHDCPGCAYCRPDERVPVHPKPYRLVPGSKRRLSSRGCVWLALVAACLVFWAIVAFVGLNLAAPRSAPHPTIGPLGSVDVRPGPASPSTPASDTSDPKLSGAPYIPGPAVVRGSQSAGHDGAPQPTPALITAPSERPYQSAIGTALFQASATWCAPTPRQCGRWGGHALLAALPTYTGTPYVVRVIYRGRSVDVTVVSWCSGCGIDLSPWAFQQLAPLSRGRIDVEIEGPIGLPATDGE